MKTILLIDSGNTRLKVGVIGNVGAETRVASAGVGRGHWNGDIQTHALDNNDIQSLKEWLAALPHAPIAALGTNVAGEARAAIIEATLAQIGCPLRWIVPQARAYGLTSRYTRPEQLGADRWVSMLGVLASRHAGMRASSEAYRAFSGSSAPAAMAGVAGTGGDHRPLEARLLVPESLPPFLLASFGTATTLDTVSGDNVFEGGLILPGPALIHQSLASGTANLPLVQGDATAYPTDTQHAISSGVAAAQAGAVLRQWLAGVRRYGDAPHVYAAGGGWREVEAETRRLLTDAATAMDRLPPTITVIENPVLQGLARIAVTTNSDFP